MVSIVGCAYTDDLLVLSKEPSHLNRQVTKVDRYNEWTGMDLSLSKCAITDATFHSKLDINSLERNLTHKVHYRGLPFPYLKPNQAYQYLGIQVIPTLNWQIHNQAVFAKLDHKCNSLLASPASIRHTFYYY